MTYRFKLELIRVANYIGTQVNEWGKDEMRLLGFAISRKGRLFATGYRAIGSFEDGEDRTDGTLPMTLCETELEDDGLEVLVYFWLIEEDGGGVRHSADALEAEFRESYREQAELLVRLGFPRDCIPFTAFYKAVGPLQGRLEDAATRGRNDEVFEPVDYLVRHEAEIPHVHGSTGEYSFRRGAPGAGVFYALTIRFTYSLVPIVHD